MDASADSSVLCRQLPQQPCCCHALPALQLLQYAGHLLLRLLQAAAGVYDVIGSSPLLLIWYLQVRAAATPAGQQQQQQQQQLMVTPSHSMPYCFTLGLP